jgi:hypothetical protein
MISGSGTSWICTIKFAGKYAITGMAQTSTAATGTQYFIVKIFKNGAAVTERGDRRFSGEPENGDQVQDVIDCVAGDVITIRADSTISGAAVNLTGVSSVNVFTIARVGS